jgi:hypothetical protein
MISYFNFDNYGGSMSVVDRAALFATNSPSPEMDVGLLVPNATIGSGASIRLTGPSRFIRSVCWGAITWWASSQRMMAVRHWKI